MTAEDALEIERMLIEIETITGLEVLNLPLEHPYHIDLGFKLW